MDARVLVGEQHHEARAGRQEGEGGHHGPARQRQTVQADGATAGQAGPEARDGVAAAVVVAALQQAAERRGDGGRQEVDVAAEAAGVHANVRQGVVEGLGQLAARRRAPLQLLQCVGGEQALGCAERPLQLRHGPLHALPVAPQRRRVEEGVDVGEQLPLALQGGLCEAEGVAAHRRARCLPPHVQFGVELRQLVASRLQLQQAVSGVLCEGGQLGRRPLLRRPQPPHRVARVAQERARHAHGPRARLAVVPQRLARVVGTRGAPGGRQQGVRGGDAGGLVGRRAGRAQRRLTLDARHRRRHRARVAVPTDAAAGRRVDDVLGAVHDVRQTRHEEAVREAAGAVLRDVDVSAADGTRELVPVDAAVLDVVVDALGAERVQARQRLGLPQLVETDLTLQQLSPDHLTQGLGLPTRSHHDVSVRFRPMGQQTKIVSLEGTAPDVSGSTAV